MVVTVGAAIVKGVPVPIGVPPQLEAYQTKVVPEPPSALKSIVPPSFSQILVLLELALRGANAGVYNEISNELEFEPIIDGPLLITLIK